MTEIKQKSKPQEEHENKADGKQIKLSDINNQKYLVQRKGRHIVTFPYEPELKDLVEYGPGTYTVMFTKPSFSFCKSITVPTPKERIRLHEKHPPPKTHIPPKKSIETVTAPDKENKEPPPPAPPSVTRIRPSTAPRDSPKPIFKSQPKQTKYEISQCRHCKLAIGLGGVIIHHKTVTCKFCHNQFCSEDCLLDHKCPTSIACFHCRKRFPKEYYIRNRFCGRLFCTLQCAFQCQEKKEDKNECLGCEDYLEEYENGELVDSDFERPEPEIECSYCDATGEDFDPGIFCHDCDKDDCFYCSWECFNEAHRDMDERHSGVRFEDLPDP